MTNLPLPTAIHNMDIVTLYNMANRTILEIQKSSSESSTGFHPQDITRVKSYSDALQTFKSWVVDQPRQDHPETHPNLITLEVPQGYLKGENDALNQLQRMVIAMRNELIMSASAGFTSWIETHDAERFDEYMAKYDSLVTNYIEEIQPLDTPESSPRDPSQGPGRRGGKGQ
jgi:hypothetical protein